MFKKEIGVVMVNSSFSKVIDCPYCEHSDDTDFSPSLEHIFNNVRKAKNKKHWNFILTCTECKHDFLARFEIDLHVKVTKILGEVKK